jgi:hypothetical protein
MAKTERRAAIPRGATPQGRSESPGRGPEADKDLNDPELLATQAREAIEKSVAELRKQRVPIATEPPTVYRP